MTPVVAVGFMLSAILGSCFAVMWWSAYSRLDDHDEQLTNLQVLVAGWLPEELDELDAVTEEIPVVEADTARMSFGEEIDADHRALTIREFGGVQFQFRTPVEEEA